MQCFIKIEIGDGEVIALKDAIDVYKKFIREKIGNEVKAPYWARLKAIERIEEKIIKEQIDFSNSH